MPDSEPSDAEGRDGATQRRIVRDRYTKIASPRDETAEDCCSTDTCCGDAQPDATPPVDTARQLGYSSEDLDRVDGEVNLGLGCGNPQAIASIASGETVLDLGSGAGFDCFLAAQAVGDTGQVIGVDMTAAMVEKARANAAETDRENVEFRLGEIEHLPVPDECVDVIISNCVINLSPNKAQVFRDAFRVLRPGGRLAILDVVMTADPTQDIRADPDSVASCVAGASTVDRLQAMLTAAGFEHVDISPREDSDQFIREWDDEYDVSDFLVAAHITAQKPGPADE